ncbi:hypothetical protein EK21DRAFT_69926, partial [Setomelanomma holmii]
LHMYSPLLPGPESIRLMYLAPALDPIVPLRVSFQVVNIHDPATQYDAISYTWDEPIFEHVLLIDHGSSPLVTKNLNNALRRFRLPATERMLWAVAVCINQGDDEEKARQIPLMAEIFRQAKMVLAWLEGGATEKRGLNPIDQLSRVPRAIMDESANAQRSGKPRTWEPPPEDQQAIRRFFRLAWFGRLWVVQEIVMNTGVILFCGAAHTSWTRLTSALNSLAMTAPGVTTYISFNKFEALQVVARLCKYHCLAEGSGSGAGSPKSQQDLLTIVDRFREYHCADAHGRIFALYSMASDVEPYEPWRPSITAGSIDDVKIQTAVNYALDVRQTYHMFAGACFASNRVAQVLNAVLSRPFSPDWPSWVPDWRARPSKLMFKLQENLDWEAFLSGNILHLSIHDREIHLDGGFLEICWATPAGENEEQLWATLS